MRSNYQTWKAFREFLKGQVHEPLPDCLWDMLETILNLASIRHPYSDGDIPIALKQIDRLRVFMHGLSE